MKQIPICITLLLFSAISFSQDTTSRPITKQDYLQISKRQRNTAWILVGGGVLLEVSGAIAYQHGNAGLLLFGAGLLAQVTSIPFFISAGINKRKSKKATLTFDIKKSPEMLWTIENGHFNPALSLKVVL